MKKVFLTVFATLFVLNTFHSTAEAIPAFARKYKISCSTCHTAVPKLKEYGDDFAGNGFLLPDGEEPKRTYINTGDDELQLMSDFPIAVRFDAYIQAADRDKAQSDFQTPYGLKLLSGGPIAKNISYYFYFYAYERGEVAGLEDAYVHFNNIGGSSFDIMVGQFQVSDPLFKRELRLTFEDYQIYKIRAGESMANFTYDRGIMATYGFDFGLDLVAEVINGNGIGPAEDRLFDFDNQKTFALRASQGIGQLRIGGFGYLGKEESEAGQENSISVFGPDATFGTDKFELNIQYLHREDDNAFFAASGAEKIKLDGGFVEVIYMPHADRSKWLFTALYNKIDGTDAAYDYETITATVSHMAARNMRILTEFTYDIEAEKPKFTLGFVSAF